MGNQHQQHPNPPQNAADALTQARTLEEQADTADREAGAAVSYDLRQQASRLRRQAADLHREQQRARARRNADHIDAHRAALTAQRTPGATVPALPEDGGDAA
ncbi:hypothetical protein [Streptomyces sp. NPDC090026]|uniref:hypothetical protein n=1 Tax=Streptomyces sp. NPDC090026 TaxID=3365923 RepID=UPI003815D5E5